VKRVGITLRSYRADDVDAMHALDVICFDRPFRFTHSAMRRFAEAGKARVVIAEESGTLVGFVILHVERDGKRHIGYIVTLDVAPEHRRRGLAGELMQDAEQEALREGCVAVVLHVSAGNDPAIRFYESHGFIRSHREPDFYSPTRDAWVFHKLLRSAGD
jgi:ribosomal-protein-alanine N-acetyltransferase